MKLDAIKSDLLSRWGDVPAARLCVLIVDYIHALPRGQREMLTYKSFANAAGKENVDRDLLTAVNMLTASRCALLDARALFVADDEEEFEIDPEDLKSAMADDRLAHPETGELVADWKRHIVPFFIPSSRFLAAEE